MITLGNSNSGFGTGGGSCANTSRPAPPSLPEVSASWSAASGSRGVRTTPLLALALTFGFLGLVLVYLEVLTPDQHIATLEKGAELEMELVIRRGRGYAPAERTEDEEPIGTIRLDAVYSPIKKVNFTVTNARVGQRTDYDRLALEIWTDGSISPRDALTYAARVARDQMTIFAGVEEEAEAPIAVEGGEQRPMLNEYLYRPVEGLPISVRAFNGLQNADIKYIGELVQRTEQDMLKIKNFGRKSLNEIKEVLTDMGVSLGMRLDNLPPRNELDRMWAEQERRESAP